MSYAAFDLTGKVALITGGNRGIGLGMATALAQAGADICLWGRDEARNAAAVESLKIHGTRVAASVCDVSDEAHVSNRSAPGGRDAPVRWSSDRYGLFDSTD